MKLMRITVIGLAVVLTWVSLAVPQERPKRPGPPKLPEGVKALRDLQYVEGGHERNRLDLYLPERAEGRLPLIVWIHGGAWLTGGKENCPALPFTAKGYAVASVNYRLSQHAVFPSQIEDCKSAIRWLRANAAKYRLDPDHIGVWGSSAGGHLVAMLGTTGNVKELEGGGGNLDQSSRVQCVVDWFGPTDLLTMGGNHDKPDSPESRLIGGQVQENKEKARKASPVTYVSKDAAPFLIMHGDHDNTVPPGQSEELTEALKKVGVEVKLVMVKGNGHGGPGFGSPENRKLIEEFFGHYLRDPFQPLLDHVAKQQNCWSQDNDKTAGAFHHCMDSISKDKEKAVVQFVGDNNERAYWIGAYMTTPDYLHGHTAMPYLALTIWTDASERLAIKQQPTDDDKSRRVCLNILAATLAKRLGFNALAVTLKKRAEAADAESVGSRPAVGDMEERIYNSIDINAKESSGK